MARPSHANKEIDAALDFAVSKGWTIVKAGPHAHAWGRMLCPNHSREGCQVSIWSTPRNPQNHAKGLRRAVDRCVCTPT